MHICFRLGSIKSLLKLALQMEEDKSLPPLHLEFATPGRKQEALPVKCRLNREEVGLWREEGALGYVGESCLRMALLTSYDISCMRAQSYMS